MNWPTRAEFLEIRRALPAVAAALFLGALALPMWVITVAVKQYPGELLHLRLYAYPHIAGDVGEMQALNHYIGFYYPDPVFIQPNYEVQELAVNVPEWSLAPLAFVAVAATGLFVAIAPTVPKLKRGLKWQFAGTVTVFTVMLVDIQYRLYQTGHSLDPGAPVVGVDGFTPPIWGMYQVANITSYSTFGSGVYVSMLAIALLAVAFLCRDTDATVDELPAVVRRGAGALRSRLTGGEPDGRPPEEPARPGDPATEHR